jgi:hypothetical protein
MNLPPDYKLEESENFFYDIIQLTDAESRVVGKVVFAVPFVKDEWLASLEEYLRDFVSNIEKNPDKLSMFFTPDKMEVWAEAFTHESYDRKANYEEHEMVGDQLLNLHFVNYISKRRKGIKKSEMTNILHYYMTKDYQPEITRKYGMQRFLHTVKKINRSMMEDVFESFFGGLFAVSNMVVPGLGYITTMKMATYIFDGIDIDYSKGIGDARSFVEKNIFQRLRGAVKMRI